MALKFLNKKGWHTGSLRNVENVWKAEQKHEAEQRKLEELRKQIQEERERSEFRLLQEQAGLVPKQERLEFLYDSGLAVGKGNSSSSFKALESLPKTDSEIASSSSAAAQQSAVPGALFEEKPQSANDAWRKLHSDPLLLIRQKEQEALARIKNNPVQMNMIRKSVEAKKPKEKSPDGTPHRKKHHHKKSKHQKPSSSRQHSESNSENVALKEEGRRIAGDSKCSKYDEPLCRTASNLTAELSEWNYHRKKHPDRDLKHGKEKDGGHRSKRNHDNIEDENYEDGGHRSKRNHRNIEGEKFRFEGHTEINDTKRGREDKRLYQASDSSNMGQQGESHYKRRNPIKLSAEERAARLQEMQMDAELHEEQRWKRLRKAEEKDAEEALRARISSGRNFLDAAQKSVYGADKGGSSTVEESVRRRTYYLQGRSEVGERNAFRR